MEEDKEIKELKEFISTIPDGIIAVITQEKDDDEAEKSKASRLRAYADEFGYRED